MKWFVLKNDLKNRKNVFKRTSRGFTIVELLVVIVVIAVLAAITVVAYNGIRDRTNDTVMRDAAVKVEKATRLWYIENGQQPRGGWSSTSAVSGTNCADGTGGWFGSTTYPCTMEDILRATNYLPSGFSGSLPTNAGYNNAPGRFSMMFYPCGSNRYALFWNLRLPTAEDAVSVTAAETAGCPTSPRTNYGMRAAKLMTLE